MASGERTRPVAFLDSEIVPELALARALKVSVRTLRRLHAKRGGPARIEIARRIYYRKETVAKWLASLEPSATCSKQRGAR